MVCTRTVSNNETVAACAIAYDAPRKPVEDIPGSITAVVCGLDSVGVEIVDADSEMTLVIPGSISAIWDKYKIDTATAPELDELSAVLLNSAEALAIYE